MPLWWGVRPEAQTAFPVVELIIWLSKKKYLTLVFRVRVETSISRGKKSAAAVRAHWWRAGRVVKGLTWSSCRLIEPQKTNRRDPVISNSGVSLEVPYKSRNGNTREHAATIFMG